MHFYLLNNFPNLPNYKNENTFFLMQCNLDRKRKALLRLVKKSKKSLDCAYELYTLHTVLFIFSSLLSNFLGSFQNKSLRGLHNPRTYTQANTFIPESFSLWCLEEKNVLHGLQMQFRFIRYR